MKTRILALLAVLVVVGGGAYAAMRLTAAPEDSAITLVPKDAVIYATVYIEPSSSQRSNLDSILTKLPRVDSLDKAKQELAELLDPVLSETGLTFERDIEPWLGAQAAFFATVPEGETGSPDDVGVLIAAEDEEAARSAVERGIERAGDPNDWEDATYEGVAYRSQETDDSAFGFIDGYLVAGTESGSRPPWMPLPVRTSAIPSATTKPPRC